MLLRLLTRLQIRRPVDAFLVRWFDYSLVSRAAVKGPGVTRIATFTLTTEGRQSGDLISLPIFYFAEGDSYLIVGSVGGRARHADWYHNLLANPHAWVYIKRKRIPVTAVVLAGEERTQAWERVSAAFPNYTAYQERAQPREIPVVRLDPRG